VDIQCYMLRRKEHIGIFPKGQIESRKVSQKLKEFFYFSFSRLVTYLLIYLLTPRCRILFEKLTVTVLVKKYLAFLWNPQIHHRVHKSPPLDPILSQLNPVRPVDPYLPKVHLNVILPSTPCSSE